MTAVLVQTADAIKDELNTISGLVREIDPERSYSDWELQLSTTDRLFVDVVPVNVTDIELETRSSTRYQCRCYITARYRFRPEDRTSEGRIENSEIDDLIELLQQFNDHFTADGEGRRLSSFPSAVWVETTVRSWYVREHLREWAQFTGIVEVAYDAFKEHGA